MGLVLPQVTPQIGVIVDVLAASWALCQGVIMTVTGCDCTVLVSQIIMCWLLDVMLLFLS